MNLLLFLTVRLIASGSFTDAAPYSKPVEVSSTRICPATGSPEARVYCLNRAALDDESRGDFATASRLLGDADGLWQLSPSPRDELHGVVLSNLGEAYEQLGRWRDAGLCFQGSLQANEHAFGRGDVRVAYEMVRLASVEAMLGNPGKTEELLTTAILLERRAMPASAIELSSALGFMAMFELQKGDHEAARKLASEGVDVAQRRNLDTPEYAVNLATLAGVYIVDHNEARALPLVNTAIDILERRIGAGHPRLAPVLMDRALVYQVEGKLALAEADGLRAMNILTREAGPDSINAAWAQTRLSSFYIDDGRIADAEKFLPSAVETQRRFYGCPNWRLAASIAELARLRAAQLRTDEASTLYRESLAMFDACAPRSPEAASALRSYAALLRSRGASKREVNKLIARARSIQSSDKSFTR